MIGWYTDNELSKTVLGSIPGIELKHIDTFQVSEPSINIFYGILRGCSRGMLLCQFLNEPYYYIDNGYFDALYVDKDMHKSMDGKFRIVKNGMHEVYPHEGTLAAVENILVLPPSPYSANFYDTTPEDWIHETSIALMASSDVQIKIRYKDSLSPLEESLSWCDGVVSFNSMSVMKAVEMGKAVIDTHGIFRSNVMQHYNLSDLRTFYDPKQFTLEEIRQGAVQWN